VTHLLDSSAFLAFFFREPGWERVEALFRDPTTSIGLCVVTSLEFWARLKSEGQETVFDQEWNEHLPLFEHVVAIDASLCLHAIELRRAATDRLPTLDSLIAAAASVSNAILVHRDPHFTSIPSILLRQVQITDR
jgi:predicted nucleic acid-binding protein